MDIDDIVVKLRAGQDAGFASLAPQAITRAVLETLERQETVSIDDIIATMQGWLDKASAMNEPARVAVTAGINHLEDLRERRR